MDVTQTIRYYDEAYWVDKLLSKIQNDFFDTIESWDEYTAISALDSFVESTRCDVDEEITEADEKLLDNIDFSWLIEDEQLNNMSYNLNNRIQNRGAIDLDRDGKGFYKRAVSLTKAKLKELKAQHKTN